MGQVAKAIVAGIVSGLGFYFAGPDQIDLQTSLLTLSTAISVWLVPNQGRKAAK